MPTENRSSNTEMVNVPPYIGLEPLVGRHYPAKCRRCGWVGSSEELTEDDAQCTRDIGDRLCLGDCDELERHDLLNIIQAMAQPAEQHQGEPVAWQVEVEGYKTIITDNYARALSEQEHFQGRGRTATIHPLGRVGDPGEVERLRAQMAEQKAHHKRLAVASAKKREALKAELCRLQDLFVVRGHILAERDALLREIHDGTLSGYQRWVKIEAALSASAESTCCTPTAEEKALLAAGDCTPEELWGGSRPTCPKCIKACPSAPGERDEQAAFKAHFADYLAGANKLGTDYNNMVARGIEIGWMARAGVPGKPSQP